MFYLASEFDLHPLLALALAAPVCALMSLPMALLIFRLRGAYFAVGTWVLAETLQLAVSLITPLGAGSGMSLTPAIVRQIAPDRAGREMIVYWVSLAIAIVVSAIVYLLLRSKHGLALTAIRDSERASESLGVDTYRTKLMIYVVTAACTGVVGAFIFLQKLRLSPEAGFSINDWTVVVIFMVVIGGIGTLEGPIIGMLIYFALREFLAELRDLVPDPARGRRGRHHAAGARRHLGPGGAQVQSAPVLRAALFDAVVCFGPPPG